jgi:hypothetical protein
MQRTDKTTKLEHVNIGYTLEDNKIGSLLESIPRYHNVCKSLMQNGVEVEAYLYSDTYSTHVQFSLSADSIDSLETKLRQLFDSEIGLPNRVMNPQSIDPLRHCTKEGFELVKKILRGYGKKVKIPLIGINKGYKEIE